MPEIFSALSHPQIDPVIISLGPFQVHWYGMAYAVGIIFGWWYARKLVMNQQLWKSSSSPMTDTDIDDFLIWAVAGIILGGRTGHVLFYDLKAYLADPVSILTVWRGGMSFHGGLIGIIIAMILFARRRGFSPFHLFDVVAASCGIGIFLGRVSNFINAELYGATSDLPWAVIFPGTDGLPRHPSQIYEGLLEGLLLFAILSLLIWRYGKLAAPGFIGGAFLAGYAISRIVVEFVRLPDEQLGYLFSTNWITMGMVLSVPVFIAGIVVMATAAKRVPVDG